MTPEIFSKKDADGISDVMKSDNTKVTLKQIIKGFKKPDL